MAAVFTKLASQLSAEKFSDLAIIPVIFIIQTTVSWTVAFVVAKVCRLNRRASNFVTAMGVFGNSNSLPISLVLSLSQTLNGLRWDKIPGDNDDEVAARGILYLLIFQQLGQLVRWSWGYHVLLAPKSKYPEYRQQVAEEGRYRDDDSDDAHVDNHNEESGPLEPVNLVNVLDGDTEDNGSDESHSEDSLIYEPAGRTPVAGASRVSLHDGEDDFPPKRRLAKFPTALTGNHPTLNSGPFDILSFPRMRTEDEVDESAGQMQTIWRKLKRRTLASVSRASAHTSESLAKLYNRLPGPIQACLRHINKVWAKAHNFLWQFMNPPLWAMLIAVLVASIPRLQRLFFEEGSFVNNSVTSAVKSSAGVAVPLILVVLGANLARNTQAKGGDNLDPEEEQIGTRLLIASLVSRMLLPTCIMAPILAVMAKYLAISVLDDPIFVIVCFLLTGAPSALQLAQICQINNVYEKTMGRVLFQSYVVWYAQTPLL